MQQHSIAVVNVGDRDRNQDFAQSIGHPKDGQHAPVSFHAYAAATGGSFHHDLASAVATRRPILLLITWRLHRTLRALRELKRQRCLVMATWKETGRQQIERQLRSRWARHCFRRIVAEADGVLAATPESLAVYREAAPQREAELFCFLPTPYPLGQPEWDFALPLAERRGIFVGTREFKFAARRHREAVALACELAAECAGPVTVINIEGRSGRRRLVEMGAASPHLRIVEGRLPYPDYLRLMARHRLVLQRDASAVPGQVAGDTLLCRSLCLGGNSAIENIAFAPFSATALADLAALKAAAARLLRDDDCYHAALAESQRQGWQALAFPVIAAKLDAFVERLRRLDGQARDGAEQ